MVTPASSLSLPVHRTGVWNLPKPSLPVRSDCVPGSLPHLCPHLSAFCGVGVGLGKPPGKLPQSTEEGEERQGLETAGSRQPTAI